MLFVGNSYTYYNNLPELVARLSETGEAPRPVRVGRVTLPGATLSQLWRAGAAVDSIRTETFDWVVLQEQSLAGGLRVNGEPVLGPPDSLRFYGRLFRDEATRHGARTALLLTWAREGSPEQQAGIDHNYVSVGRELGVPVIPAGPVWARLRRSGSSPALHASDGSHPSPGGSFATAAVVRRVVLGERGGRLPTHLVVDSIDSRGNEVPGRTSEQSYSPGFVAAVDRAVRAVMAEYGDAGGYPATRPPPPVPMPTVPEPTGSDEPLDLLGTWRGPITMQVPGTLELSITNLDGPSVRGRAHLTLGSSTYDWDFEDVKVEEGLLTGMVPIGMGGGVRFDLAYQGDALVGVTELCMGRPIALSTTNLLRQ